MKLTFLSADRPLTKSYVLHEDGTFDSTPYPLTYEFTSHEEDVRSLEDFYVQLSAHSTVGHCLLKGNLQKHLNREPRAGLVAAEQTTWGLFDFDGLDPRGLSVEGVLAEIGLPGLSYVLQYSASQGIKAGLNAHVFTYLSKPENVEDLKRWLKWMNLSVPFLREQITLTKTGMALHWPLDITVCQNDKLIYIAPPNITGGVDPVEERNRLVIGTGKVLTISKAPPNLDDQIRELIEQLRVTQGLPNIQIKTTFSRRHQIEVFKNPDQVSITGVKRHGHFTYININGGDSWGYYHRTNKPEVLFNFKGEPQYLIQEINPDYYRDAKNFAQTLKSDAHRPTELNGKPQRWVINRRDEGKYYKVTYKPGEGVTMDPAPSVKHVDDWCVSNKIPVPDAIEDWDVIFDPTTVEVLDATARQINVYRPTAYKSRSAAKDSENGRSRNARAVLGTLDSGSKESFTGNERAAAEYIRLIKFVCGNDDEATERFVNWLAFIWQTGKKPGSSWVFHGNYGTGKGRLARVLDKMFGQHFVVTSPEAVSEQYNAAIAQAQILWIDEVTTDAWDNAKITPKLRNWITDDVIALRVMRRDMVNVRNYMGIIIAANEHNPVEIRFGDRRWNVAPRQETPLLKMEWATPELIDSSYGSLYQEANLQEFCDYLQLYVVDDSAARIPLENDAKQAVMRVTQNLPEDIVQAFTGGNTSFFLEYVNPPGPIPNIEATEYKQVVEKMIKGGRVPLHTTDIRKVFEHLAGWQQKAAKFNKACAKFGLHLSGHTVRDGKSTYAGRAFDFTVTPEDKLLWSQLQSTGLKLVREERQKTA